MRLAFLITHFEDILLWLEFQIDNKENKIPVFHRPTGQASLLKKDEPGPWSFFASLYPSAKWVQGH